MKMMAIESVNFKVEIDSDPEIMTKNGCKGKRRSCSSMALPIISRKKLELFGHPLQGWRYDDICQ
jgi:hypothetical protein